MALRGSLTHRKTRRLAILLEMEVPCALGILEALWHVTSTHAADGAIGRMTNQDIADEMFWTKDADALIATLVKAKFLDEDPKHRLIVHGWSEHADDATNRKVARNGLYFADGKMANLHRLGEKERNDILKAHGVAATPPRQEPPPHDGRNDKPEGAPVTPDGRTSGAQNAPVCAPPVPVPDPVPVPEPEEERASAPPPPPNLQAPLDNVEAYAEARRLFHQSFAGELFRFHGGTPQGTLKDDYIDLIKDWLVRGIWPTEEHFRAAVDDAKAYWKREKKGGYCTGVGPVKTALTLLVNPPEAVIETKTQTLTSAEIAAQDAERTRRDEEAKKLIRYDALDWLSPEELANIRQLERLAA